MRSRRFRGVTLGVVLSLMLVLTRHSDCEAQVLDKQKLLTSQTYLANRDFGWYVANIPFFECPDDEITTTYYYRWELVTRHICYGSPNSGYSFSEFANRPFWSGAYGSIACPSGHQFNEIRWLHDPQYARDYLRYWFRTPGAQPRNYSSWLADSAWSVHQVHPNKEFIVDLIPDLTKNFEAWESRQWVPEMKMFWQTGHDDGMEFNINSRQTKDILRGDRAFRPSFNTYMWADAQAIARIAKLSGDPDIAAKYHQKAASLKNRIQSQLWDPKRQFFFPMSSRDEEDKEGNVVKAHTLTYQSGKFAGSPHGRELHGYVPWGPGKRPYLPPPPPAGNLAANASGRGFPKASASHHDIYGGVPSKAIDGKIIFRPTPMNRWTSYGSPNATDWLEIDFGEPTKFGRIEMYIYDDRGGVQPPAGYKVQYLARDAWLDVRNAKHSPQKPKGGARNTVAFDEATSNKVRVVFEHAGRSRSGLTEIEVWKQ